MFVLAALLGACAVPAPAPAPVPPAPPVAAVPPAPEPAPAPAAPELSPAAARQQAGKLGLEAVDLLQNGDEAGARQLVERALALDPGSDLARKLHDQIRADAQKELGPVFFRYTVQRDDTLSKLAQQFLGDRFRFWILAKYNDIPNPSRLAAGQVVKIPGRAPPLTPAGTALPAPTGTSPPAPAAPETRPAEPEPRPREDASTDLARRAAELERAGDLEGAYAAWLEAAQRAPGNSDVAKRRDAARAALVRALDREATQAFQRQNLDLAIAKWDRILELDPANRKARLERERALDLKRRMDEKFKGK